MEPYGQSLTAAGESRFTSKLSGIPPGWDTPFPPLENFLGGNIFARAAREKKLPPWGNLFFDLHLKIKKGVSHAGEKTQSPEIRAVASRARSYHAHILHEKARNCRFNFYDVEKLAWPIPWLILVAKHQNCTHTPKSRFLNHDASDWSSFWYASSLTHMLQMLTRKFLWASAVF